MTDRWQESIAALAGDHLSPSSTLAERATVLFEEVAREAPADLPRVACAVVGAQPAMAALACTANVALRALEQLGAPSVGLALDALRRAVATDRRAAAAALTAHIDRPVRVVTTSASAAVIEALQALRQAERLSDVVCAESRPLLEGTALARWLADQGYGVTLVCDAALGEFLDANSIFVVGTDAILPHGIANKTGTRLFAVWAALAGAERYVLASRDKLYPPQLTPCWSNPQRPGLEVVQKPPAALRVENRAFDITSRELWTQVWVGGSLLQAAESAGDGVLARGLEPLVRPAEHTQP